MKRESDRTSTRKPTNIYGMALLLAEGQARAADGVRWAVFVDNLSRITDAFAQARTRRAPQPNKKSALLPV